MTAMRDWPPSRVLRIQQALGVSADGVVGPATTAAALRYVERHEHVEEPDAGWTQGRPLRQGAPFVTGRPCGITLHESVTTSLQRAIDVLLRRHLSVHLAVDLDGSVTQHVPFERQAVHGGGPANRGTIAIEVIGPYYAGDERPGHETIEAVWAHRGRYDVPPAVQMEAVWQTVRRVCHERQIPVVFPAVRGGQFPWGRAKHAEGAAGIAAHCRWAHADGAFVERYCLARSVGQPPDEAFGGTTHDAQIGQRVTTAPTAGSGEGVA